MSSALKKITKPLKTFGNQLKEQVKDATESVTEGVSTIGKQVKKTAKGEYFEQFFEGAKNEFQEAIFPELPGAPPKAKVAPDPDSEEAKRASSRTRQRQKSSGRTSTVMTPGTSLG